MTPNPVRFLDRTTPPHIFTLIVVTALGALAMNMFLPSLPSMTAYFETDYRLMQLSVALYLGMNAVMQIFLGPISDRYGRRPVLIGAIAVFCVATLGCLLSQSIEVFLAFRMMQASVASGLVLGRAVVRDMSTSEDQAASMIGYVTMGMAVVPALAPMVGGALDAAFDWRATFGLMLGLGGLTLWLLWSDLGETAQTKSTSFRAQFADYPTLLRARRFWGYAATAAFSAGAFFAYLGGAPYVGSEVFGLSSVTFGIYFGAPAVGYVVGNGLSGAFTLRVGINRMVLYGCLTCAGGMALLMGLFLLGLDTALTFFACMIFVGLGNGMVLPNATAGMLSVRPELAGTASGLGGLIQIGGGAALSALAGTLLGLGGGAYPLIGTMLATSVLSILTISYTIRRDAQVASETT